MIRFDPIESTRLVQPPNPRLRSQPTATKHPQFSGYRIRPDGVWLFYPGHHPDGAGSPKLRVDYRLGRDEEGEPPRSIDMDWNDQRGQWELPASVKLSTTKDLSYRIIETKNDSKTNEPKERVLLDWAYRNKHPEDNLMYNIVPRHSKDPCSIGPVLLNFPDALVNEDQLSTLMTHKDQGDTLVYKRNGFNSFGGDETGRPFINRICRQMGFVGVEDRPIIGGDRLSSHGYWTNNLFQLNPRISSPQAFEQVAMDMLENGGKWFFDGAFVNEGLNGIHYLSNLYWKESSPYLDWFDYGELNQFPHEPLKLGILPTKPDPQTGDDVIDDHAWDVRFVAPHNTNNPEAPHYVELYDPRIEDEQGRLRPNPNLDFLTSYQSSVQHYRFPISASEHAEKTRKLEDARKIENPVQRLRTEKRLKREWHNFSFDISATDFAGRKWDGQRDVVRLNMKNKDVVNYLRSAMWYWGDKLMRLYTANIATALNQRPEMPKSLEAALAHPEKVVAAVNAITKPELGAEGLLPALNRGEENPITAEKVTQVLQDYKTKMKDHTQNAAMRVVDDMVEHFPLETLPAPPMLQTVLMNPALKKALNLGPKSWWHDVLSWVTYPVALIAKAFNPKIDTNSWFRHKSFSKHLEEKLRHDFMTGLSDEARRKLRDPEVEHLFFEQVGRSIMLSLLTGLPVKPGQDLDRQQFMAAYAKHLPGHITMSPPDLAASRLAAFLRDQLDLLNTKPLIEYLERELKPIQPEAAVVAKLICNERRFGTHLRVDAAKEIGDMDRVRNIPDIHDPQRTNYSSTNMTRVFREELANAESALSHIADGLRQAFQGAIIKPELTDFNQFISPASGNADDIAHREILPEFVKRSGFNGVPNMRWFFQSFMGLHVASKPDEEFHAQLSPAQYLAQRIKPFVTVMPMNNVLFFQNMNSSHDYPTATFNLFQHNLLFRYDYMSFVKLVPESDDLKAQPRDFSTLTLRELQHKPQVRFLLGDSRIPDAAFDKLIQLLGTKAKKELFSREVKHHFLHNYVKVTASPFPVGIKAQYADEAARIITPEELGLSVADHAQLFKAFKILMTEPSEVKCQRGTLSNRVHELANAAEGSAVLNNLAQTMQLPAKQAQQVAQQVALVFDKGFWDFEHLSLTPRQQRWLGYQQVDYVIDWVVDRLDVPTLKNDVQLRRRYKQALFNHTIEPALKQFERLAALQVAIPGDPTIYLPDLLGQAGGEDIKNMYLGNRELIRHDWLKTNPLIARHFQALSGILRQRYENHVLNNGSFVLPVNPKEGDDNSVPNQFLNDTGVLPFIRDNGTDQVIALINTGKPENHWETFDRGVVSPTYAHLDIRQDVAKNYKLPLKRLSIKPGTVYQATDHETTPNDRWYVVNSHYELVKLIDGRPSDQGIDIQTARTLRRVDPKAAGTPSSSLSA
ncbi:MAG: hypothetical protein KC474_02675 [Cyanobacteria bacterium HKST-UBA04]|nr:hypothetical protein [Cyanobacteria bacterium HKST-UBA04]